jgi:signal transduction histidine kinase
MAVPAQVARTLRRLLLIGIAIVALTWLWGWGLERARFGADLDSTRARLENEVAAHFVSLGGQLERAVHAVSVDPQTMRVAEQRDTSATRLLFDRVTAGAAAAGPDEVAITIYSSTNKPLAWNRGSVDIPDARLAGPASLFLGQSARGLQLVRVEPLLDSTDPRRHIGAIVATVPLSSGESAIGEPAFHLTTSIVPVTVRPGFEADSAAAPESFIVRGPTDEPLAVLGLSTNSLTEARWEFRQRRFAVVLCVLALFALLMTGPLLDWRRQCPTTWLSTFLTIGIVVLLLAARALCWVALRRADLATPPLTPTASWMPVLSLILASPVDFALTSLLVAALTGLAISTFSLWRVGRRRRASLLVLDRTSRGATFLLEQLAAGCVLAAIVTGYEFFLQVHVAQAPVDFLRFSLDPMDPMRLFVVVGLVALNFAAVGLSILVLRTAIASWAFVDSPTWWRLRAALAWLTPTLLVLWSGALGGRAPMAPALVLLFVAVSAALVARRYGTKMRHASQAVRLFAAFALLVLPSLVMYPSLVHASADARRQLVELRYAPEVVNQRRDVRLRLIEALGQIDRIEAIADLVRATDPPPGGPTPSDAAFLIWSQTGLATQRLTSSVELYNSAGTLVSRFALKLPDSAQPWTEASCDWEVFEEVSPFFSEERRVLHAGRRLCVTGTDGRRRTAGSVVVDVTLDYNNLSFISAQNPYVALMQSGRSIPPPRPRADADFTVYGWSRRVLYTSATTALPMPDDAFRRVYASREPFWVTVNRGSDVVDAYVLNDRGAIYMLTTVRQTGVGHLVSLAELITLIFVIFVIAMALALLASFASVRIPISGRELMHEVRASFYRKLFLAFVAAAIVPVLALALVSRAYVAALMFADIESEATRTAGLVSRVIEDVGTLQARSVAAPVVVDDNIVVWLSRVIAQDVNIFEGADLLASSERNLFASGLLPTRTPGDAYRAILLDGRPSHVGRETAGGLEYIVAAAPVRVRDRDAILTVPLTSRQQETEEQIQELDRRVLLAALLFIMLGAGIGYYMAERIADPVNRLMRATKRIAHGDLDARVLPTSSDELRQLVEAFNGMAVDLQRQRQELERTNRLAAWADMARQVAHDIKNPLTPIQLNAEHIRRVHIDRGKPLGNVVDESVSLILGQVRLLRQISSEFSSFAASPSPKMIETSIADLVTEVVDPYRPGLEGRVSIATDIAPDLPLLRIDKMLIGRALTNVIENALHAMPGTGALTVTVDRGSPETVHIGVTDSGVGMDADALARIFEPYFSTRAAGTGLGLTIAKRNVELNGGTIAVESQVGRSTTVTISLPVESKI